MLPANQITFVINRHIVTGLDFLTSWVPENKGGWAIRTTSLYLNEPVDLVENLQGGTPHPIISSSLFALQSRFDHLISVARGTDVIGIRRAIKNLSQINHIGGPSFMSCMASNVIANQIVGILHASCERV
jgi:hypothetical protein